MPSLYIDASELNNLTRMMQSKLTTENFDRLMTRTMNEVGRRGKTIIKNAVVEEYEVRPSWVAKSIKAPKVGGAGGEVFCKIPLEGEKGRIGGAFHAAGGARGWNNIGKKYTIKTKIVKGKTGTLPKLMSHQGNQPPFRNLAVNGLTFTRKGKKRLPIAAVSGIAVPQMPLNKAKPKTEDRILALAMNRVEHNFNHLFG